MIGPAEPANTSDDEFTVSAEEAALGFELLEVERDGFSFPSGFQLCVVKIVGASDAVFKVKRGSLILYKHRRFGKNPGTNRPKWWPIGEILFESPAEAIQACTPSAKGFREIIPLPFKTRPPSGE